MAQPSTRSLSPQNRFTSQSETTEDLLSKQTQGLVALSDFRKRRAKVLEEKERDAQASLRLTLNGGHGNGRVTSSDSCADASHRHLGKREKKKSRKGTNNSKLSFAAEEDEDDYEKKGESISIVSSTTDERNLKATPLDLKANQVKPGTKAKISVNSNLSIAPRPLTKVALLREEQTRENLRKEFLLLQETIKNTEIVIPFVFYDGTNIPGGTCRIKKGDYIWVFLDRSRKAGAELKIGEKINNKRQWARIGVDDLMLVRGDLIIPHHFDFYYFIINRVRGPDNCILFDYNSDFSSLPSSITEPQNLDNYNPLSRPHKKFNAKSEPDAEPALEGRDDDPTLTKVVDRRWYERNKHIFPASVWQEYDPKKDYRKEIKRDLGGNAFFFL